jgi:hypothetical protein
MSEPADTARRAAPEIDRLVLAVNTEVGARHRQSFMQHAQDIGLDSPALLKHYAEFLLEGRLTESVAISRLPYVAVDRVRGRLSEWARLGLIAETDDGMAATAALSPLLEQMLDARSVVAGELWESKPEQVTQAALDAKDVIHHADHRFVVAVAHRSLSEPSEPHLLLHHRLTTVRYIRAQAHRDAWEAAGLATAEIVALTRLWLNGPLEDPIPPSLVDRGLAGPSGLTPSGRRLRVAIESDTDRISGLAFQALEIERADRFMDALRSLPGAPH